jgi:hypothetical protein
MLCIEFEKHHFHSVPIGWKVYMSCKKGRKRYLFPTNCSPSGEWNPKLYSTCDELLKMFPQIANNANIPNTRPVTAYYATNIETTTHRAIILPPSTPAPAPFIPEVDILDTDVTSFNMDGHSSSMPLPLLKECPMLYMNLTGNFAFTCKVPGEETEVERCLVSLKSVPTGTKAILKCKPPYYNPMSKESEWECKNGTWFGNFNYKLRCYFSDGPKEEITSTPRTTTMRPFIHPHFRPLEFETTSTTTTEPTTTATTMATTTTTTATVRPTITTSTTELTTQQIGLVEGLSLLESSKSEGPIMCPPLHPRSPGVAVECVSKSPETGSVTQNSCEIPQPEGSEAKYSCRNYYESTAGLETVYRKCRADGTWAGSAEGFNCVVQCGKNNPVFIPLIITGTPSFKGQWPWHGAIFLKETLGETETKKWTYICGGTLISNRAVVTAAHCLTFHQSTRGRNPSEFRIDLGRFLLDEVDDTVQVWRNIGFSNIFIFRA